MLTGKQLSDDTTVDEAWQNFQNQFLTQQNNLVQFREKQYNIIKIPPWFNTKMKHFLLEKIVMPTKDSAKLPKIADFIVKPSNKPQNLVLGIA